MPKNVEFAIVIDRLGGVTALYNKIAMRFEDKEAFLKYFETICENLEVNNAVVKQLSPKTDIKLEPVVQQIPEVKPSATGDHRPKAVVPQREKQTGLARTKASSEKTPPPRGPNIPRKPGDPTKKF